MRKAAARVRLASASSSDSSTALVQIKRNFGFLLPPAHPVKSSAKAGKGKMDPAVAKHNQDAGLLKFFVGKNRS